MGVPSTLGIVSGLIANANGCGAGAHLNSGLGSRSLDYLISKNVDELQKRVKSGETT